MTLNQRDNEFFSNVLQKLDEKTIIDNEKKDKGENQEPLNKKAELNVLLENDSFLFDGNSEEELSDLLLHEECKVGDVIFFRKPDVKKLTDIFIILEISADKVFFRKIDTFDPPIIINTVLENQGDSNDN